MREIGEAVLGAHAPLSTYAGTDPALGYGLGLEAGMRSILIGVYLIAMIVGALLFPLLARRTTPRISLITAAFVVALGYLLFLPGGVRSLGLFHSTGYASSGIFFWSLFG